MNPEKENLKKELIAALTLQLLPTVVSKANFADDIEEIADKCYAQASILASRFAEKYEKEFVSEEEPAEDNRKKIFKPSNL